MHLVHNAPPPLTGMLGRRRQVCRHAGMHLHKHDLLEVDPGTAPRGASTRSCRPASAVRPTCGHAVLWCLVQHQRWTFLFGAVRGDGRQRAACVRASYGRGEMHDCEILAAAG